MSTSKLVKVLEGGLLLLALLPLAACAGEVDGGEGSDQSGNSIVSGDAPCQPDQLRSCVQTVDPSVPGYQFCYASDEGPVWSACEPDDRPTGPDQCSEGSTWSGSCCITPWGCCEGTPCNTPLVLSFDGREPRFSTEARAAFDLTGLGVSVSSDWPTAATPWLALDRDGNGAIDDGSELFGSATTLRSGERAHQGFEALAELDTDGDGFITAADRRFGELLVWSDRDDSHSSQSTELARSSEQGLLAIELDFRSERHCAASGSCGVERARFWYRDGLGATRVGTIVDVHLALH